MISLISFASSCGWGFVKVADFVIPARPHLEACPEMPHPTGDVRGDTVIIALKDAQALRTWAYEYPVCAETHQALLLGHVEKLENRLRAFGGK